ncbi:hypothetical protein N7513_003305 [Penicillium frequentans]|uniref:Glycosyltransferase family 28 N-terminal domain-containing protein n=1 Tax=Penicillium frequentans TaxID=3151616 RepID=A0AAD6CXU5_9EURO|nr:hypothetical protein N7494_005309 [Penicillium glabrum]KAJ5557719.1 hypothetical protein N7513_003305 [Penicillium glabrum]
MAPTASTARRTSLEGIRSENRPKVNESHTHGGKGMHFSGDGLQTGVQVSSDGRLDINIYQHKPSIAGLLSHIKQTPPPSDLEDLQHSETQAGVSTDKGKYFPLNMNIVIQVIGSRGDIQPFVALGKELKAHGHRVRLATHLAFREFVLGTGLEFFSIGGDPAELMAFMVQNPSLLPACSTIRRGTIQKRRREMKEIIYGCWRSCIETGDGTNLHQIKEHLWNDTVDYRRRLFVADAIIANPPSLAHIHCAQRLGIPLHMMFTMPWTPTQSFPHPLAVLHQQDCKPTVANFVSYAVVDMMIWGGIGGSCEFVPEEVPRTGSVGFDHGTQSDPPPPSSIFLPVPRDWSEDIDICGFSVLPTKSDYKPPKEIHDFLNAGPTPVYVGFGSIVVDDQIKLTKVVFEAIKNADQRAIVSKGWGNLGVDEVDVPDNILIVGSVPHDWLFQHVSCVIHHGGAGTTAAGLALGRPTIIVPFFGDQHFWGRIVAVAGAGPGPIPHKQLTVEKLTNAIKMALKSSTQEKARDIANKMQNESGVRDGVRRFHQHLDLQSLQCAICPSRPAVWHVKHTEIGLSAFVALVLVQMGRLKPEDVVLNRASEYDTWRDPSSPLSASAQVLVGAIANFVTGIGEVPYQMAADIISAGRAIGNPHDHNHPVPAACAWRKHHRRGQESSEEFEQEQYHEPSEYLGPEESNVDDDDGEMSLEENDQMNGSVPSTSLQRKRSLQLEKSQTMSCVEDPKRNTALTEIRTHGSRMSMKLLKTVIWLPTDLTLSLSKGFHNAPKLYHDRMVKPSPTVIGFRSGVRAAGTELRDGFYYGLTGLVTQPQYGLKHQGAKGLAKGIGKGIVGGFFKPAAGLWGLAGYPLVGLRRRLQISLGKKEEGAIVASRIEQGVEEMRASSADERAEVARKWLLLEEDLRVSQ